METKQVIPDDISMIAYIVRSDWKKVYIGADPYLEAMESINSITDNYFEESAATIVNYFLANAQSWRGPIAKAVKAKLNALLKTIQ
ncbi:MULTISPECIES: hypothetical protein [Sphingobacterium]|uniref:hypothetical protein n=1 Tax=Sphingobacterium TaxID=28453 RepID=UPI0028B250C3|nr:hypothetical protein [Sphingobacterium multivorum]